MRYKLLGKSGLRVSELCLGTMTFGEDWGWGSSKDESRAVFEAFTAAGGNFIDTANMYTNGSSEKITGELIGADRDRFVLATKYTLPDNPTAPANIGNPNAAGNHRKNLMRSVESSLKRLNTDYIDLLWLHAWDLMTPVEEVMRGLDDLVTAGKVNYVGISDTPAWIISQANTLADLRGWTPFVALQIEYSLIERTVERDLIPMAKAVVDVAGEIGHTPSQVALAWLLAQGPDVVPIIGSRKAHQIADNLACLDVTLAPAHLEKLDDASRIALGFPHEFLVAPLARSFVTAGNDAAIVRR